MGDASITMAVMAKRKGDRHATKQFQIRLHASLRQQLKKLSKRNLSTMTAEITTAIRKHLTSEGLWPPGKAAAGDPEQE